MVLNREIVSALWFNKDKDNIVFIVDYNIFVI